MPSGELQTLSTQLCAERLLSRYLDTRAFSAHLCEPLETEDYVVQSMPDVSPTRWHLAHTTWFFETFVLKEAIAGYQPFDHTYEVLFNSYYNSVGQPFPRPQRGLLTRPTVQQVFDYRSAIDDAITDLFTSRALDDNGRLLSVIELGIHHEQQHQELMLMDIKHVFSCNPLLPSYRSQRHEPMLASGESQPAPIYWHEVDEGITTIGHEGSGFAFDNESPRHRVFLESFQLADRLITCAEYQAFIEDGGYQRPELWLSAGWDTVRQQDWHAPLYWHRQEDQWFEFTLTGSRPLNPCDPVVHVSYFEADAFARWHGSRLPLEAEWETVAEGLPMNGSFVESERYHPAPLALSVSGKPLAVSGELQETQPDQVAQMYGELWQWTSSPYVGYPGYAPAGGALGEYNGKFMCNQYVLRGGACVTAREHMRTTYRNFFSPQSRWQFSGIRLAR